MFRAYVQKTTFLVALLVFAGCATGPQRAPSWEVPAESASAGIFEQWFDGEVEPEDVEVPEAAAEGEETEGDRIARLFVAGEVAYWEGDVERAFERYRTMLEAEPGHPLNRYAAARVYDLRDEVVDYRGRLAATLEGATYGSYTPLARLYLSLTGQTVAYRRWDDGDSNEPFAIDGLGFPTAWRTSPRLSPWRAVDFDRSFPPEQQNRLQDRYLAPWFAEDTEINRRRTRPYLSGGLSLSPNFNRRGVHYMETFATVEPAEAEGKKGRDYWLYGQFAGGATVWVDGKKVLERQMGNYGTGKRLRRVTLQPGTHRVLVKLAFEPGYRDWFDLAFIGDDAGPTGGSGISFAMEAPDDWSGPKKTLKIAGDQQLPAALEPAFVGPEAVADASSSTLYLTALAAFYDQQPAYFDAAWGELTDRHEEFAAAWGLKADQVLTLWELPSNKRGARALVNLRKAREYDADSLHYLLKLAERLEQRNRDSKEVRELLEIARQEAVADKSGEEGRLRNVRPLVEWADYLSSQGFEEAAEQAWQRVVEVAPTHCRAARQLQRRWASRSYHPPLEEITPKYEQCPQLERHRIFDRPDRQDARLAHYEQQATRYPYNAGDQISWADELRAHGKDARAKEVLERARDRMPWSNGVWNRLAEMALADEGPEAAVDILEEAVAENGSSSYLLGRMSAMTNDVPLRDLMRDGRQAAMDHLEAVESGSSEAADTSDEAYYVIDYAARKYAENGSSQTLTHTVVRAMTKGAIDRFGETSIPNDAELLVARTINQDGSVRVPERTSGKSALSMPGLDEGDFVEIAYLRNSGSSPKSRTHREGIKFYFQMSDISSLHSEYAIVGDADGEFIRRNDAPEPKSYKKAGYEGVNFLRTDSPRPRGEPYTPGGTEYLPWIQFYRSGLQLDPFEVDRRYAVDQIKGSLEVSEELERQIDKWRKGVEPGSRAEIKQLFYKVTEWVTEPSATNFGRDVAHTFISKSGSPHLLLHAAFRQAGIDSEVYLVKSEYQHPERFPVGEFSKYRNPLLRVAGPEGEDLWLNPAHPDAMFNAVAMSQIGQPAVCVTCEERKRTELPEEGFRKSVREVTIEGELDEKGVLTGTTRLVFHGVRAASVRSSLRGTLERTKRRKFLDRVVNGLLPGSNLTDFTIERETARDESLAIDIEFERPNFARQTSGGTWRVQMALFREPVASAYGKLRTRQRPMMIGRQRQTDYKMTVDLPDGLSAKLESRSGEWSLDSEFGEFARSARIADGQLTVDSTLHLPIQRVSTDRYQSFRQWAVKVEQSSRLLMTLQ